jgi:hypothetical protein
MTPITALLAAQCHGRRLSPPARAGPLAAARPGDARDPRRRRKRPGWMPFGIGA